MAARIFVDFDVGMNSNTGPISGIWNDWAKPPGVFLGTGVVSQNQTIGPSGGGFFGAGRTSGSSAFGHNAGSGVLPGTFSWGSTQIAVKRSVWGIGDECWCSFDIKCSTMFDGAIEVVNGTSQPINAIWRWGDLKIVPKLATLVVSTYTVIFSVKNNGTEVATITVPNLTLSSWAFVKVAAKLNSSTGYITATIDGVAMSAAVTGVNTVSNLPLGGTGTQLSADHITFGAPVFGAVFGNNEYVGAIDNIYIDDASHPTGRPRGERLNLGTSSTDVSAAAVGTGATTIADALQITTDAKAARFTGAAASSIIDLASYSTSGLEPNLIGINLYMKRPASRDPNVARFIAQGIDISGVQTMGTNAAGTTLPVSSVTVPPNTDYPIQCLFDNFYTSGITTSNLANVKVRLLTS